MNKLFEDCGCRREELREEGSSNLVIRQGPQCALVIQNKRPAFMLKPDITVWMKSYEGAKFSLDRILDANWKSLNPASDDWGVDEAGVYQLLA